MDRTIRPFRLAFAAAADCAFTPPLTLLDPLTRRIILQQALTQAFRTEVQHSPREGCMYTVSGSISLPVRGSFRLSLAVLVHYRSPESIEPWRVVPPDSHGLTRDPWYLGTRQEPAGCRVPDYHRLWSALPGPFRYPPVGNSSVLHRTSPATPQEQALAV